MRKLLTFGVLFILAVTACTDKGTENTEKAAEAPLPFTAENALRAATQQLMLAVDSLQPAGKYPRSIENGGIKMVGAADWTSGFFPGSLWLAYEFSKDEKLRQAAEAYTQGLQEQQYNTGTHDIGFMMYCSYGEGLRITENQDYVPVLVQSAQSLATRFNPNVGCIKSWDWSDKWQFPVIVDNMMNLELLFWAAKNGGGEDLAAIAEEHAQTTMQHHFRPDYSSYHVVDYDTLTGEVLSQVTHQGNADSSAWARGQSWGLYGYTVCYEETGKTTYLMQAENIAKFIMEHPRLPADKVPYWDFDAPNIPNAPRDASAAAINAAAFLKLSKLTEGTIAERYRNEAEAILGSLYEGYTADLGTNGLFILKHATGNFPENSEVDVPLNYADYYYLEALMMLKNR